MGLAQVAQAIPSPLHVTPFGRWSDIGLMIRQISSPPANPASGAWPANNRALYIPVRFDQTMVYARFFTNNGSNAAGNEDIGVYDSTGTRLVSTGATARSGTSQLQFIDVTDGVFPPGAYYLALVLSSTTGTMIRSSLGTTQCRELGILQEDLGGTTLPSTMTPAAAGQGYIPMFGFTSSATL